MTIREDQLIERIRRRIPSPGSGGLFRIGNGDDAAVLRASLGAEWVLTCDQFIEGVHFLGDRHPPEAVGFRALARAASDVVAMGAQPRFFLLSMALPAARTGRWLDRMLKGMAKAARQLGLTLAGGDTARVPSPDGGTALSLTVGGEIQAGRAVQRRGARPGDTVFVTGRLGKAQLGLELVLHGLHRQRRWRRFLKQHYYPTIPVQLGQWLAGRRLASAMMDLSDGLSTDLSRLCRASRVGACLYAAQIPCVLVPKRLPVACDALILALHGGEDYGLLFTVPKRLVSKIPQRIFGTGITPIGKIVRGAKFVGGEELSLIGADGNASALAPKGWDHFRPAR